jgi:IclR family acetate operon transcriptional repressor
MPMPDDPLTEKDGTIPPNLRLLTILDEVARAGVPVKPAAIGKLTGLPKPTVHRLFQLAEAEGFLQRDIDGRSYGPGPRLRTMAVNTMSSQRIRTARLAILKAVADEIGETCNLAIPDREGMTYLDRVETHWPLRIQLPIGTQVPFHCTASGKMYLSTLRPAILNGVLSARPLEKQTDKTISSAEALREELVKTRGRGYSTDDEEFMIGMTAVAVTVHDTQKRLLATLSIHAPVQRYSVAELVDCLPVLQHAAQNLSNISSN